VERNVLRALLRAPAALAEARTQLAPEDFEDEAAAALAAWMWAGGEGEPPEGEPGALARELLAGGDEAMDWAAEAAGAVRRIRIRNLQRERRSLQARLRSARGGEQDEVMARIQAVSGRLRELTTS
ncbi:MAG TPA: hypothetical protein VGU27_10750, partial [Candidatus Eisenbacteria bacterium]|nr:hypothetical protein [Candidatus Eisenbacteria bacterium]